MSVILTPIEPISTPDVTGFAVTTDHSEYSRHEPDRKVVTARAALPPGLFDSEITFDLKRSSGQTIDTKTVTGLNPVASSFAETTFDLSAYRDATALPVCVCGDYFITATTNGATATSAVFIVSHITVDNLKSNYCKGLPLYARDVLMPKRQPTLVTGVTIVRASHGMRPGIHTLAYTVNGAERRLKLDKGPEVILLQGTPTEYLPDERGNYLEAVIDWYHLPATSGVDAILLDVDMVSDEALRGEITRAVSEMERAIGTFLEPLRVATEPYYLNPAEGEYFDRKATPAVYYRQDMFPINAKVWHVSLPYIHVQRCDTLEGYFGGAKSLDIAAGVFKCNVRQGIVEVLPQTTSYVMMVQVFAQLDYWGIRDYISDFWRYKAVIGLAETTPDLLKAVAFMAAVPVLTLAGQAMRGGLTSESISKDGVSRSTSVPKGMYSATIDEYKEWLKDNKDRIINRYKGMNMVVL